MALTGIQIFKLLPKTNCKECGEPTCLAFAMKLATQKVALSACPYVSEETKAQLAEATAPPIEVVTIGVGDRACKIGGETVMYRHEKRFENQPGFAVVISDNMAAAEVDGRLERFAQLRYERVGFTLKPQLVAVKCESGNASRFVETVSKVQQNIDGSLILMSPDTEILAAALKVCGDQKPLLYAVTKDNIDQMLVLVKEYPCPVAVKASGLEELSQLTQRLIDAGIKNIVLDSGARTMRQAFEDQVVIRGTALNKKFRALGFPTIVFPCEMTDNPMKEAVIAAVFVAKYGGIIVLSDFQGHSLFPLFVERMNIYTDPQRPLATTEGIYEIGKPDKNSPVLITSNFSLTYFIVSGEISTSKVDSYLLVKDTEGLSVVTAWAAGKLNADSMAAFVKKCGIGDMVSRHRLVIPGYVAAESGELDEQLPDWEILIGPKEGSGIPSYLKTLTS